MLPPYAPVPLPPSALSRDVDAQLPAGPGAAGPDLRPRTAFDSLFLRSPAAADVLDPQPGRRGGLPIALPDVPSPRIPTGMGAGTLLTLEEVLASAFRTYPPYLATLQEIEIARGGLLSAQGGFDLNVNADARNWGLGDYKRYLYDVFLEQPTTYRGTKFFTGYRIGLGKWPIYYQYLQTLTAGAFVAGMETPLLKNGRIDAKRAKLWQSQIEARKVEPLVTKRRIELVKEVSKAYLSWWAAAQRLGLAEDLVRTAVERDRGLARQVQLGILAPIDRADSQRVVYQRQGQLVYARRKLQQTAIDLSLFLRDAQCLPWIPDNRRPPEQLPLPDPPTDVQLGEDIEVALRLRPELRSIRLQGQKADVERQFAENQQLPSLNFYLYSEQNFGEEPPSTGTSRDLRDKDLFILETSLLFDVPLQRRVARGQIAVAYAALRQIRLQERFAADRIVAEVRDDFSALQAAYKQLDIYARSADVNRQLEAAERRKFSMGTSTVLALALREQATVDAVLYEIDAAAEYLKAFVEYRAALAADVGTLVEP